MLLGLSLAGSFVYLRYTKPVYQSTAIIQRSSQDEGKRVLDIDGFESETDLSEDVELLKSTFLLEKALKNLNLEISYFSEGEILTDEKYLLSSYHITVLELKDSSLVSVPISVNNSSNGISLEFTHNGKEVSLPIQPNEPINNDYFHLIFKINDQNQFNQTSVDNNLYFKFNNYQTLTNSLHGNLNAFALNPEARTIQISFQSNNHMLSRDVVSSVITTFFQYDLEKKRQSSASVLNFIDTQLDTVFMKLKESEMAIQNYKDSNAVSDPSFITNKIMDQSNELQSELLKVDFDFQLIREIENSVTYNDRIEIFKVIPAITGTKYEKLLLGELEELHEYLVQREDLSYSVTEKNDQIKKLDRKIETQNDNIFRILANLKNQLKFQKKTLQDKIYQVESQLMGIPQKEMELSRLNRMFNLNEKYYTLLIEKKTQYSISKAGYTLDNMVLQQPSDAVLISPRTNLVYGGTFVLALLLGLVYLIIKYITFNEIFEPADLKKILPANVGVLGIVPQIQMNAENSTLMVHRSPKSALSESYRHIRSNLQFILNESDSNVIAVSSSISGEGKTFVATNLAGILAMSSKRVLVVDLDLRKPKVHLAFSKDNEKGMSSILASNEDWKGCIQNTEIENLHFISAGPIPPNPSELILSKRMDEVVEEFKKEYDVIIIDNTPVGIVSDGIGILNKSDCPIYIFRSNYSKRFYAQRVHELVNTNKVNKLFTVLNGQKLNRRGYGYGYGYGEYYTEEKPSKKWWQFWK